MAVFDPKVFDFSVEDVLDAAAHDRLLAAEIEFKDASSIPAMAEMSFRPAVFRPSMLR